MKNSTCIYILASLVLIVLFAYIDYIQNAPIVEIDTDSIQVEHIAPLPSPSPSPIPTLEPQKKIPVKKVTSPYKDEYSVYEPERAIDNPPPYRYAWHRRKSLAALQSSLDAIPLPPHVYKEGQYDCSQMAAYAEYHLENKGYKTTISVSDTHQHAWVTVHGIIGHRDVDVECTRGFFIDDDRYEVEKSFNTIYEVIENDNPKEWDWWRKPRPDWKK